VSVCVSAKIQSHQQWHALQLTYSVLVCFVSASHFPLRCVEEFSQLLHRARSEASDLPLSQAPTYKAASAAAAAAALRSALPLLRQHTSLAHPLHSNAHDALACLAMRTGLVTQAVIDSSESVRLLKLRLFPTAIATQ
jgi:hypothetical protein